MTTVNEEGKALVEQSTFDKGKALAEFSPRRRYSAWYRGPDQKSPAPRSQGR